ncbi:MAG: PAS domain-containing protein [Planctomycetes bacterium]|nr:PAS domain-containing protein [Planctomycetota bacterium]
MRILACIVYGVNSAQYKSFALSNLSSGLHCLKFDGDWETVYASTSVQLVMGIESSILSNNPSIWIGRLHPSDVDAVRAALDSLKLEEEITISYRIRDEGNRYRWVGYQCKQVEDGTIVGMVRDIARSRTLEYTNRIHLSGRDSLSTLLDSSDLNNAISTFLQILGEAMVVDRARLVRFRSDGCAFITHEWIRAEQIEKIELPHAVPADAKQWWEEKLATSESIVVNNSENYEFPERVREGLVGAIMAVPAKIYGKIEGFICFEVSGERNWLTLEVDEAIHTINGYARAVERRIDDRRQIAEEFSLRRSEEKYRQLTAHSPVILFGIDAEGTFTLSEGLGLESMGAGAGEVVGRSVYQIYRNYPDILEQVNAALAGTESHGLTHIGELCFEVWFTPVWDEERMVIGISGVAVDITRRNKLEQQQTIMMSELDHRVKNNIAAVMSLVSLSQQSAKTIEDFAKTLDGRLHALAVAHSTLAKSHWNGAWMRDILLLTLQPYMSGSEERIVFIGSDIELPGLLARPMCMVIHELATNAVKHGSLSNSDGLVTITSEHSQANALQLTWVETGGPKITSACTVGTGTSLLDGLVDHELHGTITMRFDKDGLVCKINVPLTVEE